MKNQMHQTNTFEDVIEKIEQVIECMEPDTVARISDIAGKAKVKHMDGATKKATVLLLKKYGIKYKEE